MAPVRVGVRAAHREMRDDGMAFAHGLEADMSWEAYLRRPANWSQDVDVPDEWVPSTLLLADVGGEVVGRTLIRHRLNDFLAREGGHIGYGVVPRHRRRGYATEILRQSVIVARSEGLDRVPVTCFEDNPASARVIERCGGVPESRTNRADGALVRRYRIG